MTPIKAVIFDVGGVLIEMGTAARDNIATELGVDQTRFTAAWKEQVLLHGSGKISEQEFWSALAKQSGFDASRYDSLIIGEVFARQLVIWPDILTLAEKLRQAGIVTAILSDTIDAHARVLREAGVYDGFAPVLLSCEIGIRKPAPEAFTYALDALGIAPEEAIFVDDRPENVEAARVIGIRGIAFHDPAQFKRELQRLIPELG